MKDKDDLLWGKRAFGQREHSIYVKLRQGSGGVLACGMQSKKKQKRMRLEKRWRPDHARAD